MSHHDEHQGEEAQHALHALVALLQAWCCPTGQLHVHLQEDDIMHIKGMGTVQKGTLHKCNHRKTGRIYDVTQRASGQGQDPGQVHQCVHRAREKLQELQELRQLPGA